MSEIKECEFLEKEVDGCYLAGCIPKGYKTITNFKCKNNPNCYFKQNLALKKENEELQEKIISYENEFERIANIDNNNVSILEEKLKIAVEALESVQNNLDNILLPDYEEDYGNYNTFYQQTSAVITQALNEVNK